jgi:FHS family Na+ dependent glucose MFS transporter 1
MPVARDGRLTRTIGYCAAYIGLGLSTAILGPTLPGLAERTQSQLGEVSLLFTAVSVGYLAGSLRGGWLYDRVRGHPVMAAGLLLMAVTLAAAPVIPNRWLLAVLVLLLGGAEGAVDVGGNVLLVWVYGRRVGPYMNALHFFFGVGAFLSPIVVAQAVQWSGDIAPAYWVLALFMLPTALWLLRLPSPTTQARATGASPADAIGGVPSPADVPARPSGPGTPRRVLLVLIVLLFFLYVGAEASFGGWIYTYALALDLSGKAAAAYLTSAFWGALTLGRLLAIPIAARFRPVSILLADLGGCLVSLGILLLWPNSVATWLGTVGLGLSMASIFPTLLSLAERRMHINGQVTGWFLAGSGLGGMGLPWFIGQLFESVGPRSTMAVIAVDLLVAVGILAALAFYSTRRLFLSEGLLYNEDK